MRHGIALLPLLFAAAAYPAPDAYEQYVKTSRDFQRVKQDKAWSLKAFPSWTIMPWYYQWYIGYTDASGQFCRDHGINGAFINGGRTDHLDWINQFGLRFYMDHTAGKGDLHQWDGATQSVPFENLIFGTGVRYRPVNAEMKAKLEGIIKRNIERVKGSPYRSAYALDDEISWGHFLYPAMWNVTDDKTAFPKWLDEIYGGKPPARPGWISYNDILPKLRQWSVGEFDASPLMDQWTFNDSYWNNFIGDLVAYSNSLDPDIPMGYVGGQQPNAFGGFDYAKIMRKVQYTEAYGGGNTQSLMRSLAPANVNTPSFFYKSAADAIWQTWSHLANGDRGTICWVEKWFEKDGTPRPWLKEVAPAWKEATRTIGPLVAGADWIHDGVALYYSHASTQLSWVLDAEAHGTNWPRRRFDRGDPRHGSAPLVRRAWMSMLQDEGVQFNWIDYAGVVENGVPAGYKVLVLPHVLALSDAEARRIRDFVKAGGTVIADYLPGLWDQHGKGRPAGGALDDVFGVKHDPGLRPADLFGGRLWVETDQDANYGYDTYDQLLTKNNTCLKDASGFNKAVRRAGVASVRRYGKGTAVLMNLSPQWYLAYRMAGAAQAARRAVFMQHVHQAGVRRWVELKGAGEKEFGHEIVYWKLAHGRTLLFVVMNPEVFATSEGGGNSVGLKTDLVPVTLSFAAPVRGARDERTGGALGTGREFRFDWKMNEALVVSFEGPGPGKK